MVHLIYIELMYCPLLSNSIHQIKSALRVLDLPRLRPSLTLSLLPVAPPLLYVCRAHTICTQKAVDETFRIILCAEMGIF